jgi:hypothetical protein
MWPPTYTVGLEVYVTISPVVEYRAVFQDSEGERTTCVAYAKDVSTTTLDAYLSSALEWGQTVGACSQALCIEVSVQGKNTITTELPPSGNGREDVEDKAFLVFQAVNGGQGYKVNVPAPLSSLFGPDGETVNPAAAPIVALCAELAANECSCAGQDGLAYVKGYARRAKTRRTLRQGIYPELGG